MQRVDIVGDTYQHRDADRIVALLDCGSDAARQVAAVQLLYAVRRQVRSGGVMRASRPPPSTGTDDNMERIFYVDFYVDDDDDWRDDTAASDSGESSHSSSGDCSDCSDTSSSSGDDGSSDEDGITDDDFDVKAMIQIVKAGVLPVMVAMLSTGSDGCKLAAIRLLIAAASTHWSIPNAVLQVGQEPCIFLLMPGTFTW